MRPSQLRREFRGLIVLAVAAVYATAYFPLHPVLGNAVGVLVTIPVMTCAWMFGASGGLMGVGAALVLNTVLANLTGTPGFLAVVHRGGGTGFLVLLVIAALVGLLRDRGLEIERGARALAAKLLELEQAQEKLVRAQKLAVLAKLAGAFAHEFNTPLAVVTSNLTFLHDATTKTEAGRGRSDEQAPGLAHELAHELVSCIEESREAIQRIASLVESFGQLQHRDDPRERVELDPFLAETFAALFLRTKSLALAPGRLVSTGASVNISQPGLRKAIESVFSYFQRSGVNDDKLCVQIIWVEGRPGLSISHPELVLDGETRASLVDPLIRVDPSRKQVGFDLDLAFAFQLAARAGAAVQVTASEKRATAFEFVFNDGLV